MYLRNSAGPFRPYFRDMLEDIDGLGKLDAEKVSIAWRKSLETTANYYGFSAEQRQQAEKLLNERIDQLKAHLRDSKVAEEIEDYKKQLEAWYVDERRPLAKFEQTRHLEVQRELDATRRELTGPIVKQTEDLASALQGLCTESQQSMGAVKTPFMEMSQLEQSNLMTMWGLTIFGALMMVGLFSRIACLGAAGLLALFYFAMPPWPGCPPNPAAEGNYLIVNKNLVELIACLMLATSPSGVWGGLDALVRGMITRPLFGIGADEVAEEVDDFR